MNVKVSKALAPLKGTIRAESDKSISQRLILFSLLTEDKCQLKNLSQALDPLSALEAVKQLGLSYTYQNDTLITQGLGIRKLKEANQPVNCGNSGTLMRLMLGLLAGSNVFTVLTGDESLNNRPMLRVVEPLKEMGALIYGRENGSKAPLAVNGQKLKALNYSLKVPSAQVKSALILAALQATGISKIEEKLPSRDHTERILKAMGAKIEKNGYWLEIQPAAKLSGLDFSVSADFSAAAFFLGAGLLVEDSEILINDVNLNPTRTGLLKVIERMGVCAEKEEKEEIEPVGNLLIKFQNLKGTVVLEEELPTLIDEVPLLAVLAAKADGETIIKGVSELRVKESDRLQGIVDLCRLLGREAEIQGDDLIIYGQVGYFEGGVYDPRKDHRLAMAAAVAALNSKEGIEILDADCCQISQPSFFPQLKELGAMFETA